MKRSALQCVAGFIGASLIVVGVVWTCRQLSSPTQLNAAQTPQELEFKRVTVSPVVPTLETSRTPSVTSPSIGSTSIQEVANRKTYRKELPASATSALSLTMVDSGNEPSPSNIRLSVATKEQPPIIDDVILENAQRIESRLEGVDDTFPTIDDNPSLINMDFPKAISTTEIALPFPEEESPTPFAERPKASLTLQDISDDFPQTTPPAVLQDLGNAPSPLNDDPINVVPSTIPAQLPVSTSLVQETPKQTTVELTEQIPTLDANDELEALTNIKKHKEIEDYVAATINKQSTPGSSNLEGPQSCQIVVEKVVPEEVQANKQATVSIRVRNIGSKAAHRILLHDVIPQNAQFISADQNVTPSTDGDMFWAPFDLEPQREKKFEYIIVPTQEGDFGSVATVLLPIEASCKSKCSRPELKVEATAPNSVELGQNVNFEIVVTNIGSGSAYNVALLETIPEGLFHPSGSVLDNKLGVLKAGQSKRLPLTLRSIAKGEAINKLSVSADDCETQEVETPVQILSPELELEVKGVSNVYLEQRAVFKMAVNNVGDASARNIKLMAQLPESVRFVKANNLGAYKEDEHCVYWDLTELPAQTNCEVELTIESTKPDKVELVFSASGPNEISVQATKNISIDGLAALSFNITSSDDLVESGKELEYTIQIVNNGTKASSNVILQILAPDAITILATDGPSQATNRNGVVVFDRIPEIGPKSSATYKVKASANQAGDCRVGFQLSSDDLDPLVKEINTRVYE